MKRIQHLTKAQQEISEAAEGFAVALDAHLKTDSLDAGEANILLYSVLRRESKPISLVKFCLNARYIFSSHPDYKSVPREVESLLCFLSKQSYVDWNILYIQLEILVKE